MQVLEIKTKIIYLLIFHVYTFELNVEYINFTINIKFNFYYFNYLFYIILFMSMHLKLIIHYCMRLDSEYYMSLKLQPLLFLRIIKLN